MLLFYTALFDEDDDKVLFTQIYQTYERIMFSVANSILHSQQKSEDVVHDAFLKIIKHFETVRKLPRHELKAWIVIIVKNTALDMRRKEQRWTDFPEDWDISASAAAVDSAESDAAYVRLVELIRAMPDDCREILELKFVLEWSNGEIAAQLGLSNEAVAARIYRYRRRLIQVLEREGYTNVL